MIPRVDLSDGKGEGGDGGKVRTGGRWGRGEGGDGGKVGTGERWGRGEGGDRKGKGTENEEKNSGREGKFSKHGAILTHTSPSLVGTIFLPCQRHVSGTQVP